MYYYSRGDLMKHVRMMVLEGCPHCKKAFEYLRKLQEENLYYRNIQIEVIDEGKHPDIANYYDYWYVPAFYVDNQKIHEGVPTIEKIQAVLEEAIK